MPRQAAIASRLKCSHRFELAAGAASEIIALIVAGAPFAVTGIPA
jgi:hypothetical protein